MNGTIYLCGGWIDSDPTDGWWWPIELGRTAADRDIEILLEYELLWRRSRLTAHKIDGLMTTLRMAQFSVNGQSGLDEKAAQAFLSGIRSGMDAIDAKYRMLGPLVPPFKHIDVFPWVACAVCGDRPDGCNPLPDGWVWDSYDPSSAWCYCPKHRFED